MQAVSKLYVNLVGVAICAACCIAGFYLAVMILTLLVRDSVPTWLVELIGVIAAIVVSSLLARRILPPGLASTQPPRSFAYKAASTVAYGLLGAVALGGVMQFGTLLLGHMRPRWMEFSNVPAAIVAGLALGALYGLALAARPSSAQP